MTQTAIATDDQQDRRRSERAALRLNATIRVASRSLVQARVIDISTHGCRIEAQSGAKADTWVLLGIAGLETQDCRVVWRAHEFAGLEFATPLAEPVFERLLADQSQLSEKSITELRDIANRTHRLGTVEPSKDSETLAELSSKCAADAVVEALRLGEAKHTHRP